MLYQDGVLSLGMGIPGAVESVLLENTLQSRATHASCILCGIANGQCVHKCTGRPGAQGRILFLASSQWLCRVYLLFQHY